MNTAKKSVIRIISVILSLALIATSSVTSFAASPITDETHSKAVEIANRIEDEGIVLLKNEDNVLPLKNKKVNVFGAASCSIALAGAAGSGAVRSDDTVGFYDALKNAGIEYNKDIYNAYANHTGTQIDLGIISYVVTVLKQFFGGGQSEMPVDRISDKLMKEAAEYSQTAIIVIGRVGTEMKDLSIEQLNITEEEKAMIDRVCENFSDVIVVFNISNIMDMSWLNDYENIKGEFLLSNNENFNEKFISSQVNIHACISREAKDAKPYYMDRLYFSDYSGLYFLAEGDTKLIKDALDLLQHEGIGTDKNVGNGAFECSEEEIEEITLEFPEKSDYVLSLSTFIPESKEQLDNLIGDDNVAYDFQRRGGWITTQPISKLRKNTIYAFTAASVFYAKDTTKSFTSGEFKDLTPKALIGTIKHSIYRCGKSIFIPLKL